MFTKAASIGIVARPGKAARNRSHSRNVASFYHGDYRILRCNYLAQRCRIPPPERGRVAPKAPGGGLVFVGSEFVAGPPPGSLRDPTSPFQGEVKEEACDARPKPL